VYGAKHLIDFRPATPTARSNTPSGRVRNLPCTDISNRESSPGTAVSQRAERRGDSRRDDVVQKVTSVSAGGVEKTGRARRSLQYDNNENVIDDLTTEFVFSRKRPVSPDSAATDQPRKRRRTELELCTLESLDAESLQSSGADRARGTPRRLSTALVSRKSGQWKVSTPSRERAATTPPRGKDGAVDTPSKSVTFHDSVVGGDSDEATAGSSPTGTPRSGRRSRRLSSSSKCESPSQSAGKLTPRAQRNSCPTPRSGQKGTPGKSADVQSVRLTPKSSQRGTPRKSAELASDVTPQRSSTRLAVCDIL